MFRFSTDSISGSSSSMLPDSKGSKDLITFPLGSTKTLLPLFADLITNFLDSIDLKIDFAKCWWGPMLSPNHASSEMFTIKLEIQDLKFP